MVMGSQPAGTSIGGGVAGCCVAAGFGVAVAIGSAVGVGTTVGSGVGSGLSEGVADGVAVLDGAGGASVGVDAPGLAQPARRRAERQVAATRSCGLRGRTRDVTVNWFPSGYGRGGGFFLYPDMSSIGFHVTLLMSRSDYRIRKGCRRHDPLTTRRPRITSGRLEHGVGYQP